MQKSTFSFFSFILINNEVWFDLCDVKRSFFKILVKTLKKIIIFYFLTLAVTVLKVRLCGKSDEKIERTKKNNDEKWLVVAFEIFRENIVIVILKATCLGFFLVFDK